MKSMERVRGLDYHWLIIATVVSGILTVRVGANIVAMADPGGSGDVSSSEEIGKPEDQSAEAPLKGEDAPTREADWLALCSGWYDPDTLGAARDASEEIKRKLSLIRSEGNFMDVKDVTALPRVRDTVLKVELVLGTEEVPDCVVAIARVYGASTTVLFDDKERPTTIYLYFDRLMHVPKLIEFATRSAAVASASEDHDTSGVDVLENIEVSRDPENRNFLRFVFSKVNGSKEDVLTTEYFYYQEKYSDPPDRNNWFNALDATPTFKLVVLRTVSRTADGTIQEYGEKPW